MFCGKVKEYLSQKHVQFEDRDVTKDPDALYDLQKLDLMTTPVTVVGQNVIVGFDISKLDEALNVQT